MEFKTEFTRIQELLMDVAAGEIKLDVCELGYNGRLVTKKILPHKTASQSRTIFAYLLKEDLKSTLEVALKISLSLDTPRSQSLVYEAAVYKYIIDNIIRYNYSP